MEELIELLNEYEDLTEECEQWCIDNYGRISEGGWWFEGTESWICSKKFGFIKRLVENDKIDLRKLRKPKREFGNYMEILLLNKSTRDTGLLMLLAISNSPIDDLINYLR